MMTSGDEMSIKALLAVLGRPGWGDEGPKMMIGTALVGRPGEEWAVLGAGGAAVLTRTGQRMFASGERLRLRGG